MSENETILETLTPDSVDGKSHSSKTVLIPVIAAVAAGVVGFAVRAFRRPKDSTTILTLAHDEAPASE